MTIRPEWPALLISVPAASGQDSTGTGRLSIAGMPVLRIGCRSRASNTIVLPVTVLTGRDPAAGQTIDAIARQTGATGTDVMFDLIMTHENRVNIVAAGRSEADVRRVLTRPLTVVGSDGIAGSVL
jgi:N-acyl-D-aspartate/D-glutamate deacylase